MRGPATLIRLSKKAFVNHRQNIAQGGVLRTMVDLGILLRCQVSLESVPKAVDNLSLALIEGKVLMSRPKFGFAEHP